VDALKRQLKDEEIKPVYVLCGSEELLKREAAQWVIDKALDGGSRTLNLTRLVWKEVGVDDIINASRTMPMFGARSVIVIQDVDSLKSEQSAALAEYLDRPSPHTTWVIICSGNADMRLKFFKKAKSVGLVKSFKTLYANQLPDWIQGRFSEQQSSIAPDAAALLADTVGSELAALNEAIERLILYVAGADGTGHVTLSDVEHCVARTRVYSVFELTDALGRRRPGDAIRILVAMLDAREQPIRILAMIGRHFRRLLLASEAIQRGESEETVGRHLNVHSYFLKDFLRQARMFGDAEYRRFFKALYVTDCSLKSSRVDPELHLHRLVLGICSSTSTN
jgi:DNA polymerase-3 subunit delta